MPNQHTPGGNTLKLLQMRRCKMAESQIIWTVLPYGMQDGSLRVSVVVSPRLTPETLDEEYLQSESYKEFHNWPDTVLNKARFTAEIGGVAVDLKLISKTDPKLWRELFPPETLVSKFEFMDMSKVNLVSYPIRGILGFLKDQYSKMAVDSPLDYPKLLPWYEANDDLKKMLWEAGTRTEVDGKGQVKFIPGFDRFFDKNFKQPSFNTKADVPAPFATDTELPQMNQMELNVMNPDWNWEKHEGRFKTATEYNLYQADRFYRRVRPTEDEAKKRRPDFQNIPGRPETDDFDFHGIIASLSSYPELMRRLGLVLDFLLIPPRRENSTGRIKLNIAWKGKRDSISDITPWTAFVFDPVKQRFITRARTEDIKNGMLSLDNAGDGYEQNSGKLFDVYQVDPDGAALKTVNFVLTAQNLIRKGKLNADSKISEITSTTGDKQGYAALRSGGLGVSRNGRALNVATDAAAAKQKNDYIENGDITLFAEDVLRGYRVDVARVPNKTEPGVWNTLCARTGEYRMVRSDETIDLKPDEGYVSGPSTTSGDSNPDDHYLHESLFRWTGWSLCTPRPGPVIVAEKVNDSYIQSEVPRVIDEPAQNASGVIATFTTSKGTLPRLRYGRMYRLRARIVDLAGNSIDLKDPTLGALTGASDAVGYWRFEPIDPPTVVHRARVSEGESLERMVIRSDYDIGADPYHSHGPFFNAIQLYPASVDFSYNAVNERHFAPPKSSQSQCETHGLFDVYAGNWKDIRGNWANIKKGYEIAAHDEFTLNDEIDGIYSDIEVVTPTALDGIATTKGAPQPPSEANPTGDRMAGGQYIIHKEPQLIVPYLPDGASEGVAIRAASGYDLPGVEREDVLGDSCTIVKMPELENDKERFAILVKHGGKWPNLQGFRLILAEVKPRLGPWEFTFADRPVWNEKERTLTLYVPKGWIVRLVYSSFANKDYIDSFGILNWIDNDAKRAIVRDYALYGANWFITTFRDLTLVHATQRPVHLPEFKDVLNLYRELGSHDVKFHEKWTFVHLHGPSTGKFEVEAEWSEWVDDPAKDAPELVHFKGQLGEIPLKENHHCEDFDDANHRDIVNLMDEINARMKEADPQASAADMKRGNVHSLGDTHFRIIKYRIRATTRFREYLPPSIYENQENVTRVGPVAKGPRVRLPVHDPDNPDPGAPILLHPSGSDQQSLVPASAPPADPRVLYVVPTMRWGDKQESSEGYSIDRGGNSLRVWLDRPWFSSGDGELLGVVIYKDGGYFSDIPKKPYENLVSQWGADPFWKSNPSKQTATIGDFPKKEIWEELKLQETSNVSNTTVMIIGHRVHFDYNKKLWYCDIVLGNDLTAYMPFIRLALVRYQPNALDTVKISKVVLTDFAQVLPTRKVTVTTLSGAIVRIALSGKRQISGPLSKDNPYMPESDKNVPEDERSGRNRVELLWQQRDPSIESDLAWSDEQVMISRIVTETEGVLFSHNMISPINPISLVKLEQPKWRRLVLREFERFYSDDVELLSKNRVIEERLVFSYIITV